MPDLFNPLSLLMQRFWQGEDHTVPNPSEPYAKQTADPEAMLYDQPSGEPMPELEAESIAEASALKREHCAPRERHGAHTEALSRFEHFRRSL